MRRAVGLLETTGFTPAAAALDAMEKRAGVTLWQAELNDFLGVCLKIEGPLDRVEEALEAGREIAERMRGRPVAHVLSNPEAAARPALESRPEYNPLIQQDVVYLPLGEAEVSTRSEMALGFLETQGFTAVFAAVDSACKAANVEVIGKEKLGGGYVTVVLRGDVAAVRAAVEAGSPVVESLGKLIAAHVIARPSSAVLALLPK